MSKVRLLAVGALTLPLLSFTGTGASAVAPAPLVFGTTQNLGAAGGEPSIQDDGHGTVYITSPSGTPAGLGSCNNAMGVAVGVEFWRSINGGASFGARQCLGTPNGGGDTDVTADHNQNLWTADLAAADAHVQFSSDHGTTFSAGTPVGPEDDRQWLTPSGDVLYFVYHDFANNEPIGFKSTDHGTTFTPLGVVFGTNAQFAADAQNNTLVSKPVVDAAGNLFILTNTSTSAQNSKNPGGAGPFDRLYLSESTDGGSTFTATNITAISYGSTDNTLSGTWAKVFNQLAIDAGGNLYVAASGYLHAANTTAHTFLIRGLHKPDGSYDWNTLNGGDGKTPIQVSDPTHAQVFPDIAVGQAGQVAVGYYGTTTVGGCDSTCFLDYRNNSNQFQFYISQTLDALDPSPTFTTTQVTTISPHPGGICTDGLFCNTGTPGDHGGNRNLADFESMTVDPTGHIELIIPADTDGSNTEDHYYKETSGPLMVPGVTNGNGTGNQTFVSAPPPPPLLPEFPLAAGALLTVGALTFTVGRLRRRHLSPAVD